MENFNLTEDIVKLLHDREFFGHLLLHCKRNIDSNFPAPAGVSIRSNQINLYINPDLYMKYSKKERVAILEHEMHHVIQLHPIRRYGITKGNDQLLKKYNIAADIAINQFIENLPSDCMRHSQFGLKANLTSEEYFKSLPCNNDETKCRNCKLNGSEREGKGSKGEGEGKSKSSKGNCPLQQTDGHPSWDYSKEVPEEIAKNLVKSKINIIKEHNPNCIGSVPNDLRNSIDELYEETKVSWKSYLNLYIQRATQIKPITTRKKPSRRFGYIYPGKRNDYILNIGVCIDTSGSISDENIKEFLSEIKHIHKSGTNVTVIESDCNVGRHYKIKKSVQLDGITGGGGTSVEPGIETAEELELDLLVYFTDFGFNIPCKNYNIPIVWVYSKNNCYDEVYNEIKRKYPVIEINR